MAVEYVTCPDCGGTGTVYPGGFPTTCHPCVGTGRVWKEIKKKTRNMGGGGGGLFVSALCLAGALTVGAIFVNYVARWLALSFEWAIGGTLVTTIAVFAGLYGPLRRPYIITIGLLAALQLGIAVFRTDSLDQAAAYAFRDSFGKLGAIYDFATRQRR